MPKSKPPESSPALTISVSPISADTHLDQDIDGLLCGVAWNLTSPGRTVTYSFPDSPTDYSSSISGFQQFNADQQTAVRTILDSISAIANISFVELSGQAD